MLHSSAKGEAKRGRRNFGLKNLKSAGVVGFTGTADLRVLNNFLHFCAMKYIGQGFSTDFDPGTTILTKINLGTTTILSDPS